MSTSKAARQVRGWMDIYSFDDVEAFAAFVASVAGCSELAVAQAMLGDRRPAFVVARAIAEVTGVDAHDWFIDEPKRAIDSTTSAPPSETFLNEEPTELPASARTLARVA